MESMDVLATNTRVNKYVPIPIDLETHLRMSPYCQVCSGQGQTRVYGYQNHMLFIMRNNTEHLEHARKALEDGQVSLLLLSYMYIGIFYLLQIICGVKGYSVFAYP